MFDLAYDYASCVRNSEKVAWTVDEVMPAEARLDFSRPFMPAKLTGSGSERLTFLTEAERLTFNHINAHAYINLFAHLEEYIVVTAVNHAQAEMFGDHDAIRALMRFADEEIKHQDLFRRYLASFGRDFPHRCEVVESAAPVIQGILSKTPLAVVMTMLHFEVMTQSHFLESVQPDTSLDPLFARILRYHWMEECQHAKIDALELRKLSSAAGKEHIQKAFSDYLETVDVFDALLAQQAKMDCSSLALALGRSFTEVEYSELLREQHRGYRSTFLIGGMGNATLMDIFARIDSTGAELVARKAAKLG